MRLYYHTLSGHSHRAHLFLSLISAEHELIEIDLAAGMNREPGFQKLNPFDQAPVPEDEGVIVADSNAILVYAAEKFGRAPAGLTAETQP